MHPQAFSSIINTRQYELEAFLDQSRKKFLGYGDLNNDNDTLIGLPYPIHESVRILKQVSLVHVDILSKCFQKINF